MFAAPHETAHGTSRTLGDVRLESAKCAKADMISRYHNRDFMSTRTRLKRAAASSEASAVTCRHREGHCVQAVTCAAGAEASHRLHELANVTGVTSRRIDGETAELCAPTRRWLTTGPDLRF